MRNTEAERQQVASMFGLKPDELFVGWEAFVVKPLQKGKDVESWLKDFLDSNPSFREGYENGTVYFARDRFGNVQGHFTPDYYIDLAASMVGKDLRDPWNPNAKPMYVEDIYPGFNSKLDRDDPSNRKWAAGIALAHEKNIAGVVKENQKIGHGRQSNPRVAVPQLRA